MLELNFFGGKQSSDDKEISTAFETPASAKKTRKYREAWKEKYKWLRFDGKENKMLREFCRELLDRKNMKYSPVLEESSKVLEF